MRATSQRAISLVWYWVVDLVTFVYSVLNLLQLSELVNVEGYSDWIRLVAEFTLKSLQSWQVGLSVLCIVQRWSFPPKRGVT